MTVVHFFCFLVISHLFDYPASDSFSQITNWLRYPFLFTFSIFSTGYLVFLPFPAYSPLSILFSSFIQSRCLLSSHPCPKIFLLFFLLIFYALCVERLKASSDMERRGRLKMILTIEGWKVQALIKK